VTELLNKGLMLYSIDDILLKMALAQIVAQLGENP
jgi:hypothetical protein